MKGVSSLIASVLILAIAVSLAGIYSEWAPRVTENLTRTATDNSQADMKCRNAALSIQDPLYDKTGEVTLFDIRNAGTIRFSDDITIVAVNSSRIVNSTNITSLGVDQVVSERLETSRYPDRMIVFTEQCPNLREEETIIDIRK